MKRADRHPITVEASKAVHDSCQSRIAVVAHLDRHLPDEDLAPEQCHGRAEGHRTHGISLRSVDDCRLLPSHTAAAALEDPDCARTRVADNQAIFRQVEPSPTPRADLVRRADGAAGRPLPVGCTPEGGQYTVVIPGGAHGQVVARCRQRCPEPAQSGVAESLHRLRVVAVHIVQAVRVHPASVDTVGPHEQ